MAVKRKTILIGVTGGIAAYKACDVISCLRKEGFDTQVILTEEGRHFITPLTLQTISCNKVMTDMFELPEEWDVVHTSLAEKCDAALVVPATANIIGKLASGICDSLLTCVLYATKAPVLIAPAMNDNMYAHKIVRENIEKLKKIGYSFVGPAKGRLACGREGMGHIADTETIVNAVKRLVK